MITPKVAKSAVIVAFAVFALVFAVAAPDFVPSAGAMGAGPPAGFSGAPDENDCRACHIDNDGQGTFFLGVPPVYFPGRTYTVTVIHSNADTTRKRWGFEMTALAGSNGAGTFTALNNLTQDMVSNGRPYITHTNQGSFANQTGSASWLFHWTAPATNVGRITFYAAGNQANNDHSSDGDQILFANATTRIQPRFFDYDGDGKSDLSITRSVGAERQWWWFKSGDQTVAAAPFGSSDDIPASGDFTGDGKLDSTVFRPSTGQWFVLRSNDFSYYSINFGSNGDLPAAGDYDGDGKTDAAVYRPSTGTWYVTRSSDNGVEVTSFGSAADKPVVADFDGDGKADISIWKPTLGQWWRINSSNGVVVASPFGTAGDKPVPGDYTGDGKADIAIFRPSIGTWYILRSDNLTFYAFPFGISTDIPTPGDFDGDGLFDPAIFRNGTWYVNRTTDGMLIQNFGSPGDTPSGAIGQP